MAGNLQGGTNIPGRVCSSERSIAQGKITKNALTSTSFVI